MKQISAEKVQKHSANKNFKYKETVCVCVFKSTIYLYFVTNVLISYKIYFEDDITNVLPDKNY